MFFKKKRVGYKVIGVIVKYCKKKFVYCVIKYFVII